MTDSQNPQIFTKQEKMAKHLRISLDDLKSKIKPIQPSTNNVTKKEILSIITERQNDLAKYYVKESKHEGLTIQHLDPRQSRYNSVRYQFLKNSGHYLGEDVSVWQCHQECDYFCTQPVIYFVSFGDNDLEICEDRVACDDVTGIGSRSSTKHLLAKHADFVGKRLKGMGVKKQ